MSFIAESLHSLPKYLPSTVNTVLSSVSKTYRREVKKVNEEDKLSHNVRKKFFKQKAQIEKNAETSFKNNQKNVGYLNIAHYAACAIPLVTNIAPIVSTALIVDKIINASSLTLNLANIANFSIQLGNATKGLQELSKFALPLVIASGVSLVQANLIG
jgi:hypothetical protein